VSVGLVTQTQYFVNINLNLLLGTDEVCRVVVVGGHCHTCSVEGSSTCV
jgi:hypothetical protein